MRKIILVLLGTYLLPLGAQETTPDRAKGLQLQLEAQAVGSTGEFAPLWLSSNRYGITSVKKWSNYERLTLERDIRNDSLQNWRIGYGVDLAVAFNAEQTFIPQQFYAEVAYKKVNLTVGSKQQPLEMRNGNLTSGGMSYGINARPIPQIRLATDYFALPGTKGWWNWKLHCSYGMTTDGKWAESFVQDAPRPMRYTKNVLYHEKALYWKFGKEECKVPLTYEIGIQMATQFGGTTYAATGRGITEPTTLKHKTNLSAFLKALICSGGDETDGYKQNVAGNHVGSYLMALSWHGKNWNVRGYFERFFEDHSMLTLQYGIRDHILGLEGNLPTNPLVSRIVVEHINTRDQSGPIYHDATSTLPDQVSAIDNYYNHSLYNGWQNYGRVIGHPFLSSALYNSNATIYCYNNRIKAWHFGLEGNPCEEVSWRLLLSFTRNWGTYYYPSMTIEKEQHFLAEVGYAPRWAKTWSATLGLGLDHGNLGKTLTHIKECGNSFGTQFTVRKSFQLTK